MPTVVQDTAADRPGPYAALAAAARRSSDGALVAAAAIGCLLSAGLLVWRPAWWQFALALLAVGAFGGWGIADRELAAARSDIKRRLLRATCALAAIAGTIAVAITAFRIVGAVVGTVIS
jgi:hypothetical protein